MEIKLLVAVLIAAHVEMCECSLVKVVESYMKRFTFDELESAVGECDSLDFTQRTGKYGYASEEHTVTTQDGYILKLFRIVSSEKCDSDKRNVPVLLLHGFMNNGMTWLAVGPQSSVAYALSDACYDVWLCNFRGTRFSREHASMEPTSEDYWDFTMDEEAKYDLPAFIDKVLETSGSEKVNIIGTSQGAASYLAMASTNDKYQDKVGVGIMLEPAAYLYANRNMMKKLFVEDYQELYNMLLGMSKVTSDNDGFPDNVLAPRCSEQLEHGTLCAFIYQYLFKSAPPDVLNCLFGDLPEPLTLLSLKRYAQHFQKRTFQMVDLGPTKNQQKYGSASPPEYDVTKITTPISIVYGSLHLTVSKDNLFSLKKRLKNVVSFQKVEDPTWNHLSFLFALNINDILVPMIEDTLTKYSD
uniref:Lipase n=1 Tax=Tineola bisselliella TaxID=93883 RepID=A0A891XIK8_TINBI|nr:acetyltransferase [Tineola bisselliella]